MLAVLICLFPCSLPHEWQHLRHHFYIASLAQDFLLPVQYKKFMPIPSAISIPFYIGAPIAIDFCLGGAVLFFWRMFRPETAAKFGIVTGAGLMVGDGLWQLPFGILGIAKVTQVCSQPCWQW